MHKKMSSYILFFGLNVCFFIFGMEKELISVLNINNYIIPVSSAYEALKREHFLMYDVMKRASFEKMNEKIRENNPIPIIARMRVSNGYLTRTRPFKYPNFMYINIAYTKSLENSDALDAHLSIMPFMYAIVDRATFIPIPCKIQQCVKKIHLGSNVERGENKAWQWLARRIKNVLQKIMKKRYRPNYCIELCSDKRVSDWVIVT